MSEFIDIHAHILPKVDDGSKSIDESLKMLSIAKSDGISVMVAAPHFIEGKYEPEIEKIKVLINELKKETANPEIVIGADIRISHRIIQKIKDGQISKINNKNYILLELPSFSLPPLESIAIFVMRLKEIGVHTVLTHPERHPIIMKNENIVRELSSAGMYMQVTAMSLTGDFGKEIHDFTTHMFKNELVHIIATDAHDPVKRPPVLSKAFKKIRKDYGEDMARLVTIDNPRKILDGIAIK